MTVTSIQIHDKIFVGCTSTKKICSFNLLSYTPYHTTPWHTVENYLSHKTFLSYHYSHTILDIITFNRSPLDVPSLRFTPYSYVTTLLNYGLWLLSNQFTQFFDMMGLPSWMKLPSICLHHILLILVQIITGFLKYLHTLSVRKNCTSLLSTNIPWFFSPLKCPPKASDLQWVPPMDWCHPCCDEKSEGNAKGNDPLVPILLWNNCITYFWSEAQRLLECLRCRLLNRQYCQLYLE